MRKRTFMSSSTSEQNPERAHSDSHCGRYQHHFSAHERGAIKSVFAIVSRTNITDLLPSFLGFMDMHCVYSHGGEYTVTVPSGTEDSWNGRPWKLNIPMQEHGLGRRTNRWTPCGRSKLYLLRQPFPDLSQPWQLLDDGDLIATFKWDEERSLCILNNPYDRLLTGVETFN